jgi:hypothetical protein
MRILLIGLFLANIVCLFGSFLWWQITGVPNVESSPVNPIRVAVASGFCIVGTTVVCLGYSLLMPYMPDWFLRFGMPNREYWMSEKKRPLMVRRSQRYVELCGVALLLFCLFEQWSLFQLCQNPANFVFKVHVLYAGIVVLSFIAIETVRWYLSFRLPKVVS